ncbi:MAG: DUF421 domain-containing protein [Clostridium sp.]
MFIVFLRTTVLYFIVVVVMRLMGKRQIGELQPYEFVITIMISDLASLPMQDTRLPLLLGIIPIVTLLFLKTILSQLQLKSQFARKVIDGEPSILIYKSKINYDALKKQQINLDELLEEVRIAGYFDLEEIQYAILENDGELSILPKSKKEVATSNPMLPKILVLDGQVNRNSLSSTNQSKDEIIKELQSHNIFSISDVLIAMYDTSGKFHCQFYGDYEKECSK